MTIEVNQYQFGKVCDQMKKEFGVIKKGDEDKYTMMLYSMEGNLLKIHRANPSSNSRRVLEAVPLVLFQIKSYLTGDEYELTRFQSMDNERLVHALLMAFDPFTNEELKGVLEKEQLVDLTDRNQLIELYQDPILCLLKIMDSVDNWVKRVGSNGYFAFTEEYLGGTIAQEKELKYYLSK